MIGIFVIDDHPVVVKGLKSLFNPEEDGMRVISWAFNTMEASKKLETSSAKVIILDLLLPQISGVDYCLYLKENYPEKKVVVLTGEINPNVLYKTWFNKADAILNKDCSKDEIITTINSVLEGNRVVGGSVPDFEKENVKKTDLILTNREKQILDLLSKGYSRSEIAGTLNCKTNSINFHCKNIFRKFDKNNIVSVLKEAERLGMI